MRVAHGSPCPRRSQDPDSVRTPDIRKGTPPRAPLWSCEQTQRRLRTTPGPLQPPGLWAITKTTYARHGIPGFYSGVGALVAGNSLKAGVRFLSYDSFKQMLVDKDVRLTSSAPPFLRLVFD